MRPLSFSNRILSSPLKLAGSTLLNMICPPPRSLTGSFPDDPVPSDRLRVSLEAVIAPIVMRRKNTGRQAASLCRQNHMDGQQRRRDRHISQLRTRPRHIGRRQADDRRIVGSVISRRRQSVEPRRIVGGLAVGMPQALVSRPWRPISSSSPMKTAPRASWSSKPMAPGNSPRSSCARMSRFRRIPMQRRRRSFTIGPMPCASSPAR